MILLLMILPQPNMPFVDYGHLSSVSAFLRNLFKMHLFINLTKNILAIYFSMHKWISIVIIIIISE